MTNIRVVVAVWLLILATVGSAQDESQPIEAAESLDSVLQLLELVREEAREGSRRNQARIERFRNALDERQRLLEEVSRDLEAANLLSEELDRLYEQNETDLADLEERLRVRIGNFGELFGVVRDVAGFTALEALDSLVSAQYTRRSQVAESILRERELPDLEDLRGLQLLLLEEMAQSGQVARFSADITNASGRKTHGEVIRVGTFNLVHDGQFLTWNPSSKVIQILPRQPSGRFLSMAQDLQEATEGTTRMAVDPTRGKLLSVLVHTPGLAERIRQGGYVGYTIIGIGVIGLIIAFWRIVVLQYASRGIRAQLRSSTPNGNNALGRIFGVYEEHRSADLETISLKLDEAIMHEAPSLERYQSILKVFAAVAPLLGLLGTVVGMIITFQQLTLFGTGDPKLMADGISQALMTTVMGLVVAIPLVLLHSVISSTSQRLVEILEEQSAGLIARRAEVA